MSLHAKRLVILGVALFVLIAALAAQVESRPRAVLAQDVTATPTPTPSWTPTPTPTPTPTLDPFATPTPTFNPFATPTPTPTINPFATPTFTPTFNPFAPTPTWTPTFPFFATPFGTPPTPTRPIRIVTEIVSPKSGDAAAGFAPIFGTALKTAYRKYDIHISPAGSENWSWLTTSFDIVSDGQLYLLDTKAYPDGYYDIRLRAVDDNGDYTEAFLRGLEIRNAHPPTATPNFNELGTLIPPPPDSPLEPTPTPRPRIQQNSTTGQGIFSPEIGQTVSGFVDLIGTANGSGANPFDRYEIAISTAGDGTWNWLYTGEEQMWQGKLYTLDTRRFPDGYYDLRLRLVYRDANYDDYILRYLYIANSGAPDPADLYPNGIYRPKEGSVVGGIVDFIGTAIDPDFARWEMSWSISGSDQWAFLLASEQPVINGALARLDVTKLAGASLDLRLRVVRSDGNYDEFLLRNLNVVSPTPTPLPALPLPPVTPTPLG